MLFHRSLRSIINLILFLVRKLKSAPVCSVIILLSLAFLTWLLLPLRLFSDPYSLVVEDRGGALLGARIAADGQWRFPPEKGLPRKFVTCMLGYEDRRFFSHPGVDPLSIARALVQNVRAGRVVSGGSTITMQTVRLSRHHARRTIGEKLVEAALALRCDFWFRKRTVLAQYAAQAPFGGNVVGLTAAAWRYFGRGPQDLSWAEAAVLAVLPNDPALVHPGRNRGRLLVKRNMLLGRLLSRGAIDSLQYRLALAEPLPGSPRSLPNLAPHLVDRITKEQNPCARRAQAATSRVQTTISMELQKRVNEMVGRHVRALSGKGIHNAAALVLSVERGEALAYIGNSPDRDTAAGSGGDVDVITASRSTGSVLKPFLYAAMLDQGELLPAALVPDIPTSIGGFSPQNFNRSYEGAVPASAALARSLNVPAVRMVQSHGVARFRDLLVKLGMTTLSRPASDYGISIILGGAEGSLWELTGMYAGMARTVNRFSDPSASADDCFFFPPAFRKDQRAAARGASTPLSPAACWAALMAMQEAARPGEESAWREFACPRRVAWKTGTSFGFRDGWAIGCTPQYAVGVWVGNASGEGKPGLVGIETAAPLLFDILNALPLGPWFSKPEAQLRLIAVCRRSGFRAGPYCPEIDTVEAPAAGEQSGPCPFHQITHIDNSETWRVSASCESVASMRAVPWFVLPPAMEYYYRQRHSDYRVLPPWRPGCEQARDHAAIGLIYPQSTAAIYIPKEIDGTRGDAVFTASHRDASATLYWHIDDCYIGSTTGIHQISVCPPPGEHTLVIIDNSGERLGKKFTIIDK